MFVLLPFLLGEQTKWMCERALGWLVSCGVRFMVLSMVIGFLYAVAQRTVGDLGGRVTTVAGLFQVLLFNLLLLVFVALANRFAGEIAGGAASLSLAGVAAPAASAGHHATSAARHAAVAGAVLGGGAVAAYAYFNRKGEDARDPMETPVAAVPTASATTAAGSPAAAVTSAALLARSSAASRMRPAAPAPHAPEVIDAEWTYATPLPQATGPRGLLA